MQEVAVIQTRHGNIKLRFFPEVAPKHVENFKKLAKEGFYNKTTFHRVIPNFMIQGDVRRPRTTRKADTFTEPAGPAGR